MNHKETIVKRRNQTTHGQSVRNYRNDLFLLTFEKKEDLLSLYNAVRGTHHTDTADLNVTTLAGMYYMQVKNDLSMLVDNVMNLYEHQATVNPNMPLRGLEYFAKLYKDYGRQHGYDPYGKKRIPLPYPQYVVFYNGVEKQPERQILRLSDAYLIPEQAEQWEEPALECRAVMLNINPGYNKELMEKCQCLSEYTEFVETVRKTAAESASGQVSDEQVDSAIDACIDRGVLVEVLRKYREEIKEMFGEEAVQFHWECEMKRAREEGRTEGKAEGMAEGKAEGKAEGMAEGKAEGVTEGEIRQGQEDVMALLSDLGELPQQLGEQIAAQKDKGILRQWLKAAAKADSLAVFMDDLKNGTEESAASFCAENS